MARQKAVSYKMGMTLNKIKNEVANFIKYSQDVLIQVSVWNYTDYRTDYSVDIDECSLYLEVYVQLNDYDSICDNNKTWCIVDIPQRELPKEQFEVTEKKMIRDSMKIGKALEEAFGKRCYTEYDEDDNEIVTEYKTEIRYYDYALTV